MKQTPNLLLALLLGATATLSACDSRYTPGVDPQRVNDFDVSAAPPARTMEIYADSINYRQNVQPPAGKGSAADMQTSADAGLENAPGGNSSTSMTPQGNSTSLDPSSKNTGGTGSGNQNDVKSPAQQSTQQ
ncbi:hypothetical protein [Hymenobacter cavernae]|nr:hypothetical protein [Hymenobacter cavernae]